MVPATVRGTSRVTNGRARATGPQSRDLTQARGCLLAPGHAWALARGMALRGMAGRSTPEQVATPYGGLCEHARTPMRPQDDDDPNVLTQRWPRQLAQPQVRDRLAPCPPTGRSRRDHEWIGTAAASSKESPSARCSFVEHAFRACTASSMITCSLHASTVGLRDGESTDHGFQSLDWVQRQSTVTEPRL
jgi:hypothetical protein